LLCIFAFCILIFYLALLGTKLIQFQGVSHGQGHDIHGGKTTHAAGKASLL
jgi:hypothetical protein